MNQTEKTVAASKKGGERMRTIKTKEHLMELLLRSDVQSGFVELPEWYLHNADGSEQYMFSEQLRNEFGTEVPVQMVEDAFEHRAYVDDCLAEWLATQTAAI